jgi:hypothetical protein
MRSAERIFKKTFALAAVAALLVSQPAAAEKHGARWQNVPFTISSLGTAFGVQVKVEGTYTVYETYVEVNVARALIHVSEHCPYQGRRLVNTLSVGLAAKSTRGPWEIENRSLPFTVEQVLRPREEYKLSDLSFQIPRGAGTDITQRWLVVEAEDTALDLPDGDPDTTGYAFAHSRRDLFAQP